MNQENNAPLSRRTFLQSALAASLLPLAARADGAPRPNIVWIVGEDLGPELGCYGDAQAITPNMDRLASEGARFTRAFTHCAVCAPARSGLITGRYPIAIGTHHMRSRLINPPVTFTKLLRDAGYFVAWPGKTDFNFAEPQDFADSRQQWWKQAAPPRQPFFGYVNVGQTHEGQVRNDGNSYPRNTARLKPEQRHDPAKMTLPPFWPDDPAIREEVARYYDLVTAADYSVGDVLKWLDEHKLSDNTIVIFFGDHGRGMPRYKRWVYDTGTHVPMMVRWPGKIAPNSVREDLVEFLDLPATSLALGGVPVPKEFDGQIFLGQQRAPERRYVYAHRDYMDETLDRIRSVRDTRFRYVRNFMPERPYAQLIRYNEQNKTMQAWRRWHAEGKLNATQAQFFAPRKAVEELYDTEADPYEVRNLAGDARYAAKLTELRGALDAWLKKTDDMAGRLTDDQMVEQGIIHPRGPRQEERLKRGAAAVKHELATKN